jgi:hypothetical protein
MKAYKYKHLLWQFIGAIDTGKYDSLTTDEVHRHADAGTIPAFLVDRFGTDLDLSMIERSDWDEISERWAGISNAVDSRRKFGVENRGVCLLMAYTLECLQNYSEKNT